MFDINNCLTENIPIFEQTSDLEEKLSDNFSLEQFLENDDAILCAKIGGEKTRNYLDSSKIKKLIKLITEKPEDDTQLRGHKIPYIASEILKLDCPYILEHFVLSEKEYNDQYILFNNNSMNNSIENEVDQIFSKIEKKYKNKEFQHKLDFQNIKKDTDKDSENKFGKLIDNDDEDKKEKISGINNKDEASNNDNSDEDNYENNIYEINENNEKENDININENMNLIVDKIGKKININNLNENNSNEQNDKERNEENVPDGTDVKDKENQINENNDKEKYEKKDEDKNSNEDLTKDSKKLIDDIDRSGSDDNSASLEGEIADFYAFDIKENQLDDDNPHNQYLDLLLNFVMNDKPELNYVLSGYFLNVMQILLEKYPSKILFYLYNIRKDALKKILFYSNQIAFSVLSSKLLNIESYKIPISSNDYIINNINFRNKLVCDIINAMNSEGFKDETGKIYTDYDMESKLLVIFNLFNDNKYVVKYILEKNDIYTHLLGLININLFQDNICDDINYDKKYTLYLLYLNLIIKLLITINLNEDYNFPNKYNCNCIEKDEDELSFNDYMIMTFENILKYNFKPKKPKLIIGKGSGLQYEGLGRLNIIILDLVIEMIKYMKKIPNIFDSILIKNNFIQNSIDYFFKYQWNNLYHQKFVELFNTYLKEENNHKELTEFIFDKYKLHEILVNYLKSNREITEKPKKFIFKSGKKINSGVYVHVIDLMYKIQVSAGLNTFTEEEKQKFNIINLGEYEFLKNENSNKETKEIKISQNICNILKENKEWNDIINSIAMPLVKKFEEKLTNGELSKGNEKEDFAIRSYSNDNSNCTGKEGIDNSLEVIHKNNNLFPSPRFDKKGKRKKKKKKRMNKRKKEINVNNKINKTDNKDNKDNNIKENELHETNNNVNDINETNNNQLNQEKFDKDICDEKNKE